MDVAVAGTAMYCESVQVRSGAQTLGPPTQRKNSK